jgi:hypothetical protein
MNDHLSPAPVGFLLDVDGPIASPVTRTIAIPSILSDIVSLTAVGVPIAFVTGRSDAFIRDTVIAPLLREGLAEALSEPGALMFGVYEKGATWSDISPAGLGETTIDQSVAPPVDFVKAIRTLVAEHFSNVMFFDETKLAMVSIEQRTDVSTEQYEEKRHEFDRAAFEVAVRFGLGVSHGATNVPDARGKVPFRIDPTIISTDIESVLLDKSRGARRALESFRASGPLPTAWRSIGDSRSDYSMADELHSQGFEVGHVDVRPSDGVLDKPYRVIVEGDLIHDEAGAAFLRYWADRLVGRG